MSEPKPIYRTDGKWMAVLYEGNLFDIQGEWIAWLDGEDVYSLEGEYIGYIARDGRLLRSRTPPYHVRRRPPAGQPRLEPLKTVPLPPMFAELPFSIVDVFEEMPGVFARISELRPDAGESVLPRLTEVDPRLAVQRALRKVEQDLLEQMAYSLLYSYGVTQPPVPIEAMVAGLEPGSPERPGFAPPEQRQQLAESLIARLGQSGWAMQRGYCGPGGFARNQVEYAARALLLPRHWIQRVPPAYRHAPTLAEHYVAPEEVVVLRLHDLE